MSNKIKFPCCVKLEDLVEEDITALSGKFAELGATLYEDNFTDDFNIWKYYGVEESGRICFWDKPKEYLDEGEDITIYTLAQVLAATGVGDGSKEDTKPLLNVIKHLSYTIEIKGVKFELTAEEYYELINQLEDGM